MKMPKSVILAKKKFENKYLKDKKFLKLEIIVIIQGDIEMQHIIYVI